MVPWMMAQLIVSPVSRAVFVYGGQRQKLSFDVLAVAAATVSLWDQSVLSTDRPTPVNRMSEPFQAVLPVIHTLYVLLQEVL